MAALLRFAVLGQSVNGEPLITGFHAEQITFGTELTYAGQFAASLTTRFATANNNQIFGAQFKITGVRVTSLDSTTGIATGSAEVPLALAGTEVDAMPSQVALVASLQSSAAGRNGRGRMFWGGFSNSVVTPQGKVKSIAQTRLVELVRDLLTDTQTATESANPVVYSPTDRTFAPIISVRVGDHWDTQRRRANRRVETYSTVVIP